MKAQILFWLIGATDGHAKNFSIFLGPGGSYNLTPFYDVLTAEPSLRSPQIQCKQMKLAMSVGNSHHYRMSEITGRYFIQTGEGAGLAKLLIREAMEEMADLAPQAIQRIESELPAGFPERIHVAVRAGLLARLDHLGVKQRGQ